MNPGQLILTESHPSIHIILGQSTLSIQLMQLLLILAILLGIPCNASSDKESCQPVLVKDEMSTLSIGDYVVENEKNFDGIEELELDDFSTDEELENLANLNRERNHQTNNSNQNNEDDKPASLKPTRTSKSVPITPTTSQITSLSVPALPRDGNRLVRTASYTPSSRANVIERSFDFEAIDHSKEKFNDVQNQTLNDGAKSTSHSPRMSPITTNTFSTILSKSALHHTPSIPDPIMTKTLRLSTSHARSRSLPNFYLNHVQVRPKTIIRIDSAGPAPEFDNDGELTYTNDGFDHLYDNFVPHDHQSDAHSFTTQQEHP